MLRLSVKVLIRENGEIAKSNDLGSETEFQLGVDLIDRASSCRQIVLADYATH
jgi:hypothetical protein